MLTDHTTPTDRQSAAKSLGRVSNIHPGGWAAVPWEVLRHPDLEANEIVVYAVIAAHVRYCDNREAAYTLADDQNALRKGRIEEWTGLGWHTIQKAVKALEAAGFIEVVHRPGHPNVYRVVPTGTAGEVATPPRSGRGTPPRSGRATQQIQQIDSDQIRTDDDSMTVDDGDPPATETAADDETDGVTVDASDPAPAPGMVTDEELIEAEADRRIAEQQAKGTKIKNLEAYRLPIIEQLRAPAEVAKLRTEHDERLARAERAAEKARQLEAERLACGHCDDDGEAQAREMDGSPLYSPDGQPIRGRCHHDAEGTTDADADRQPISWQEISGGQRLMDAIKGLRSIG